MFAEIHVNANPGLQVNEKGFSLVVIFVVLELLAPERNVISKPSYLGMPTIHSAASIVSGERSLTIVGKKKINSKRQRAEILGADLQ